MSIQLVYQKNTWKTSSYSSKELLLRRTIMKSDSSFLFIIIEFYISDSFCLLFLFLFLYIVHNYTSFKKEVKNKIFSANRALFIHFNKYIYIYIIRHLIYKKHSVLKKPYSDEFSSQKKLLLRIQ